MNFEFWILELVGWKVLNVVMVFHGLSKTEGEGEEGNQVLTE